MRITKWFLVFFIGTCSVFSQNNRTTENNSIGWFAYFGTFKLSDKLSIHNEYQLRRDNFITDKQQGLLRLGLNYMVHPRVQLRLGYANIETYPYGEIPLNGFGKNFTEHRTFQAATVSDKFTKASLSHRFMLEQRWVGRYSNASLESEDSFPLLHRFRYMFRMDIPIWEHPTTKATFYTACYNEIFIGFGKNVNENVFDQNRIGLLLGHKFNSNVRVEGGFLNQTLQLGREIDGRNRFQNNNGFLIATHINLDFSKKSAK